MNDYLAQKNISELEALLAVNNALSREQDFLKLLQTVLLNAITITSSEGGSILLVEKKKILTKLGVIPEHEKILRFQYSFNLNQEFRFVGLPLKLDATSIAGYVATTGQSVRIRDCYAIDSALPYHFNFDYDRENSYRTKSMLAVPLKTADGEVLGVLQLINKWNPKAIKKIELEKKITERSLIAFSKRDDELMKAFAFLAATAIKNLKLNKEKKEQFKSFIQVCVNALETREPWNKGHSVRVAALTVALAETVSRTTTGPFKDIHYSPEEIHEIRVAALLHDFGKIAIKESILRKSRKLYFNEMEIIKNRLAAVKATNEAFQWQVALGAAEDKSRHEIEREKVRVEERVNAFNNKVDELLALIIEANEPQLLADPEKINHLLKMITNMCDHLEVQVLHPNELAKLTTAKGSLTSDERLIVESHAAHSFDFLSRISWSDDLARVPYIAVAHHEKLDGTGYPLGLKGNDISVPSRIMAICDIFDSLITGGRPYKKAASLEQTLAILKEEARAEHIDANLVQIFIEQEIYSIALSEIVPEKKAA